MCSDKSPLVAYVWCRVCCFVSPHSSREVFFSSTLCMLYMYLLLIALISCLNTFIRKKQIFVFIFFLARKVSEVSDFEPKQMTDVLHLWDNNIMDKLLSDGCRDLLLKMALRMLSAPYRALIVSSAAENTTCEALTFSCSVCFLPLFELVRLAASWMSLVPCSILHPANCLRQGLRLLKKVVTLESIEKWLLECQLNVWGKDV